jgi:hypothetical protein
MPKLKIDKTDARILELLQKTQEPQMLTYQNS